MKIETTSILRSAFAQSTKVLTWPMYNKTIWQEYSVHYSKCSFIIWRTKTAFIFIYYNSFIFTMLVIYDNRYLLN